MKQHLPDTGLSMKNPVRNLFAVRAFNRVFTIKDKGKKQLSISLNPILGKGPPGAAHSPGRRVNLFNNYSINTNLFPTMKNQSFNPIKINHSITIKIQSPMKKQILFLALLVIATFATVTNSYGQAVHVSDPEALPTCTNDALHPIAGKPYDYIVASAPATGALFHWWATTNTSFIAGGDLNNETALGSPAVIPTISTVYNSGTNTSGTLNLSWGTDILAAAMSSATTPVPTFVAVYTSGTTCADNLKVFQIEPVNAFMVDIKNVENATLATTLAYGATEDQCYDNVEGASWSGGTMTYNYGTNILYYEVVASNFTGTWTPTFTLSGLQTGQTATIEWDYTTGFAAPVTVTSGAVSGTAVTTNATDTSNGVSIFVRVTVANNTYEGLTNDNISLGVTGTNSANLRDVLASDCTVATLASNTATQTLNLRPTMTETTEVGTFEPAAGAVVVP